nr:MAG TPA: hypothetical protein [Caudoviricetes sp.]
MGAWIETAVDVDLAVLHFQVAPRVGAWIETPLSTRKYPLHGVAPRVGAWIETTMTFTLFIKWASHPVWVRGLKLFNIYPNQRWG